MKKAFILCCLLVLTACMDVDEYGDSWGKTIIDPSMQGHWARISDEDDAKLTGQEYVVTLKDNAYSVQSYKSGNKTDEDPIYPVKSFQIGKYTFLASGPERGTMNRYNVVGDTGTFYILNPSVAWDFISKTYPDQTEIYRDDPDPSDTPADNRDRPLRIRELNDDVMKMLAAIPNNGVYWDPDMQFKKVQ